MASSSPFPPKGNHTADAATKQEEATTLQQELAVTIRVRNRLAAQTSDAQLPRVLTPLVPRLLHRLDQNAQSLYNISSSGNNTEILSLRQQIQTQLLGALSHCIERLRLLLNPHQDEHAPLHRLQNPNQQASSLVDGWMGTVVQELTEWKSSVTWTVALSLLETALPSLSKSVKVSLLPGLVDLWEDQATTATSLQDSHKLRLRKVAGLLMDSMMACMSDDNTVVQEQQFSRSCWDDAASKRADGVVTVELILDVFLFWPASNQQQHGANFLAATGLSTEGWERMIMYSQEQRNNHFSHDDMKDDSYSLLRLKYAFARYIFLGKSHAMHHHNQDCILLLAVVAASEQSQHGRLALSYLNQWLDNHTTTSISLRCFDNDDNRHKRQAVPSDNKDCKSSVCSVSLAVALLILLLGDADAAPVLQQYHSTSASSGDNTCSCCWHSILGTRPTVNLLQRSPLPAPVAERVVQFLIRHFVPNDNGGDHIARSEQHLRLYLDLIVVLQDPSRHSHQGGSVYWGIQLMHQIYNNLSKASTNNETNDSNRDWVNDFYQRCFQTAIAVLKSVPSATNESRAWNTEDDNDGLEQDRPGGVPQPFGRRRDLNLLLRDHRERQQRHRLQVAEAVRARQVAYEMVAQLARESNVEDSSNNNNKLSFEIPILLFQCASLEDDQTQTYLVRAMDAILSIYRRLTIRADQSLFSGHTKLSTTMKLMKEHWVAPLLPVLVSAACLDHAGTRLEVVRWTTDIVGCMDSVAALHIVSFLAHDADLLVAAKSQKASAQLSRNILDDSSVLVKHRNASFLTPDNPVYRQMIQEDLELKLGHVAQFGGFDRSIASILLYDFDFSLESVLEALRDDKSNVLANSGVLGRYSTAHSSLTVDESQMSSGSNTCGICYEDATAMDYSMDCGHSFCRSCWQSYLQESFVSPLRIQCPQHDCLERVTADMIEALAPDLLPIWNTAFQASFTRRDARYRHCTGPDCPMVARVDFVPLAMTTRNTQDRARPVTCPSCDTAFCFQCGGIPHSPARCNDHEEWQRIMGSSSFWMRKNSKPCPSCRVPIEKNNGCNHMTCTQCNADFCWLCLSLLNMHLQAHTCNRYDPVSDASDDEERRALFYTARFQAHDEAEMFARDKIKMWNEKGDSLAARLWFVTEDELEKLVETMEALIAARQFLKWSYVAAWAIRSENPIHLDVFQMSQATLELVTERMTQMALLNLEQLYTAQGERGVRQHFVSMTFLLSTVVRYQQRIIAIEDSSFEL